MMNDCNCGTVYVSRRGAGNVAVDGGSRRSCVDKNRISSAARKDCCRGNGGGYKNTTQGTSRIAYIGAGQPSGKHVTKKNNCCSIDDGRFKSDAQNVTIKNSYGVGSGCHRTVNRGTVAVGNSGDEDYLSEEMAALALRGQQRKCVPRDCSPSKQINLSKMAERSSRAPENSLHYYKMPTTMTDYIPPKSWTLNSRPERRLSPVSMRASSSVPVEVQASHRTSPKSPTPRQRLGKAILQQDRGAEPYEEEIYLMQTVPGSDEPEIIHRKAHRRMHGTRSGKYSENSYAPAALGLNQEIVRRWREFKEARYRRYERNNYGEPGPLAVEEICKETQRPEYYDIDSDIDGPLDYQDYLLQYPSITDEYSSFEWQNPRWSDTEEAEEQAITERRQRLNTRALSARHSPTREVDNRWRSAKDSSRRTVSYKECPARPARK
ncbi:uncharacterized protein [Periplaneta americana]|uniref:uncharacterized protein n=1 Tax=Periplaneta americana TaxID=6978 RepID=UPI0037E950C9